MGGWPHKPFKSREFSASLSAEGEVRSLTLMDHLMHPCWLEDGGGCVARMWVTSRCWENLPADSQQGSQGFCSTTKRSWILLAARMSLEVNFFSRAFRWELSLANTMILPLWFLEQGTQTCYVKLLTQNYVLINEHCFKQLCLCQFVVYAAIENQCGVGNEIGGSRDKLFPINTNCTWVGW